MTDDALSIALDLARALEDGGVPYAIGGALALGVWAIPRATLDVDINVFVDEASLDRLHRCLAALGIHADLDSLRAQSAASGLIVVKWRGVRVDLFTPSIEFSREAERTRVAVELRGELFWFLSKETLAVFKLLFYRPKDIADVASLVALNAPTFDVAYVRSWIVAMMGDDDERVARWDRIVASSGAEI